MMRVVKDTVDSLFEKCIPEPMSGCWLWAGANTGRSGYAQVGRIDGRILAHRLMWVVANGEIPDGKLVLHKCDVRSCINPDHLFLGSYSDNSVDMFNKGRVVRPLGEKHPCAKLTYEDVHEIRGSSLSGPKLAEKYGVSRTAIYWILQGKNWRN